MTEQTAALASEPSPLQARLAKLSGTDKAAIVMLLMGEEYAAKGYPAS